MTGFGRVVAGMLAGLAGCAGAANAQDFRDGLAAYNAADYAEAWSHWWPLSLEGDPRSQASLGFMYMRGLGMPSDPAEAARWFAEAAESGEPIGQFFLGVLHLEGRGVPRDLARAHMLCELAMSGGFEDGFGCREQAAMLMTADDYARSRQMLMDWREEHGSE